MEARQDVLYTMVLTEEGVGAAEIVSSPGMLAVFGIAATEDEVVAGGAVVTDEGAAGFVVDATVEDEDE